MRQEGETAAAVRLCERALEVRRKAFGDRHPEVAESWHDLARSRLARNDLKGALEALHIGVDIFRSILPADSPQLAGGLLLLGDVLRLHGRPGEAMPYLEEAAGSGARSLRSARERSPLSTRRSSPLAPPCTEVKSRVFVGGAAGRGCARFAEPS